MTPTDRSQVSWNVKRVSNAVSTSIEFDVHSSDCEQTVNSGRTRCLTL
jgi:hypothetical protein